MKFLCGFSPVSPLPAPCAVQLRWVTEAELHPRAGTVQFKAPGFKEAAVKAFRVVAGK